MDPKIVAMILLIAAIEAMAFYAAVKRKRDMAQA